MPRISLNDSDIGFDCKSDDTILRAALRAGLGMSYSCNVGSCGNCRFELVEGDVTHLRVDSPAYTDKDRKRNRWLGCQAVPGGDCTIKFRQDPGAVALHPPLKREGTLLSRRMLNHDIGEFEIRIDGDPTFLPGQYALLGVEGVEGQRVYSMCNLPEGDIWRFQIKRVPGGAATTKLFESMQPGDRITVDGPYGQAHLREDSARDIVLLAGGSGLSPMVSIARGALQSEAHPDRKVYFFFGGRGPRDIEAAAFLQEITDPRFHYIGAISDAAQADGWTGAQGFIHEIAEAQLGEALKEAEIYFAGPPAMAAAIGQSMAARGVAPAQIHFDEFY